MIRRLPTATNSECGTFIGLDLFAGNTLAAVQLIQSNFDLPADRLKIGWDRDRGPNQDAVVTLFGNEQAAVFQPVASPRCGGQHDGPAATHRTCG